MVGAVCKTACGGFDSHQALKDKMQEDPSLLARVPLSSGVSCQFSTMRSTVVLMAPVAAL